MNCCKHKDDSKVEKQNDPNVDNHDGHEHKGHMSHMWMMALCCGVPLLVLGVISLLGASLPALRTTLISIVPFLCPIMMIFMLPMMLFNKNSKGKDQK